MRIDLYLLETDESPELEHWRLDWPVEIYVDGKLLDERITAFDVEGHYVCYIPRDSKGNLRRGPSGSHLIHRMTGNIVVLCDSDFLQP
jgi:hypothetical protein